MSDDLRLEEYRPRSPIVRPEHLVERPKVTAIDAHNHLGYRTDAFGNAAAEPFPKESDAAGLVEVMDRCGIRAIANLTGRWGDDLKRQLETYEGRFPGRFYTFANVDWRGVDEPGFGERAARQFEESVRAGARGLKVFKNLGLQLRDGSGSLIRPDDERLDPLWAKAGELGVPALIHVADPAAFFEPLDATNDSYLELKRHPDWHFYGPGIPSFRELIEAGIALMARHPRTTFITAHTGWYSENLRFVGEQILDRLPNVYTDFSARLRWLGPQPYSARDFFLKYQDRILFGTDERPSVETYRKYFRYLETADELFETRPGDFLSRSYGIFLPDEVLEKIYRRNAERVIPGLV